MPSQTASPTRKRQAGATAARGSLSLRLSGALLALCAFSASWTAAAIGEFNIVDYALAGATIYSLFAWVFGRRRIVISAWMLLPVAGAFLVGLADVFLNHGLSFEAMMIARIFLSTTLIAIFARSEAELGGEARILRLVKWWTAGIIVNAAVAVLVGRGFLSLEGVLTQPTGDRVSGLSSHPNSIAFSISIAIPVLVYLIANGSRTSRERTFWILGLALSMSAMILANSRAGLIVGLGALAISLLFALRHSKMRLITVPLLIFAPVAASLWLFPALMGTRLAPGQGDLSNVGREQYNARAYDTFLDSPLWGAGFDAQAGVSVPLQVLSAGGLVLAFCYYSFIFVPSRELFMNRRAEIAKYGLVAVASILVFSLLNPVFSERAGFWVPLLLASMLASRNEEQERSSETGDGTRLICRS